ncbi:hypothetical protein Tco_1063217, partial [Tanacetum coccineum]
MSFVISSSSMMVKPEIMEKLATKTVDKNGHPRIKGTSSSSENGITLTLAPRIFTSCASLQSSQSKFCSRPGKGTVSENKLLCCVPNMAYGPHPILQPRISLIMFEFSSCLLADSALNLVSDSSRLIGCPELCMEYSAISWMAILASAPVLE